MSINRPLILCFLIFMLLPHQLRNRGRQFVAATYQFNNAYDYLDSNDRDFAYYQENNEPAELDDEDLQETSNFIPDRQSFVAVQENEPEFNQPGAPEAPVRRAAADDNQIDNRATSELQGEDSKGEDSKESSSSVTKDTQDAIDHVTCLIKSMREHAIAIIKNMNELETDLLSSNDDNSTECEGFSGKNGGVSNNSNSNGGSNNSTGSGGSNNGNGSGGSNNSNSGGGSGGGNNGNNNGGDNNSDNNSNTNSNNNSNNNNNNNSNSNNNGKSKCINDVENNNYNNKNNNSNSSDNNNNDNNNGNNSNGNNNNGNNSNNACNNNNSCNNNNGNNNNGNNNNGNNNIYKNNGNGNNNNGNSNNGNNNNNNGNNNNQNSYNSNNCNSDGGNSDIKMANSNINNKLKSNCNSNFDAGPSPVVVNEWSLPVKNDGTISKVQSSKDLMGQAQDAVRSWKAQIESCKRVLDDAVAQAAETEKQTPSVSAEMQHPFQHPNADIAKIRPDPFSFLNLRKTTALKAAAISGSDVEKSKQSSLSAAKAANSNVQVAASSASAAPLHAKHETGSKATKAAATSALAVKPLTGIAKETSLAASPRTSADAVLKNSMAAKNNMIRRDFKPVRMMKPRNDVRKRKYAGKYDMLRSKGSHIWGI